MFRPMLSRYDGHNPYRAYRTAADNTSVSFNPYRAQRIAAGNTRVV